MEYIIFTLFHRGCTQIKLRQSILIFFTSTGLDCAQYFNTWSVFSDQVIIGIIGNHRETTFYGSNH